MLNNVFNVNGRKCGYSSTEQNKTNQYPNP